MDVALYQENCGSRPKQYPTLATTNQVVRGKRPALGREKVSWLYKDSQCNLKNCKFPHLCEVCQGSHPKWLCLTRLRADQNKPGLSNGRAT